MSLTIILRDRGSNGYSVDEAVGSMGDIPRKTEKYIIFYFKKIVTNYHFQKGKKYGCMLNTTQVTTENPITLKNTEKFEVYKNRFKLTHLQTSVWYRQVKVPT